MLEIPDSARELLAKLTCPGVADLLRECRYLAEDLPKAALDSRQLAVDDHLRVLCLIELVKAAYKESSDA